MESQNRRPVRNRSVKKAKAESHADALALPNGAESIDHGEIPIGRLS